MLGPCAPQSPPTLLRLPGKAGSVSSAKAPVTAWTEVPCAGAWVTAPWVPLRRYVVSQRCRRGAWPFACSLFDKEAPFCFTECYNTCFDVTLNKRTLSLCSPGCAGRQFFTEENKDRTRVVSTVQVGSGMSHAMYIRVPGKGR